MKSFYKFISVLVISTGILSSCAPDEDVMVNTAAGRTKNELGFFVPKTFNYQTSMQENLSITVEDNNGTPMPNIVVSVYDKDTAQGGQLLMKGVTNASGVYVANIKLPSNATEVYAIAHTLGMVNASTITINNNVGHYTFGGQQPSRRINTTISSAPIPSAPAGYNYLSGFDADGVPNNLEPVRDLIDAAFITDCNASLPESMPVHIHNPNYLSSSNQTDLEITELADVWVTFVHEGAGYKNALGFYTYDINNPPATANDIDTINFVFPNASFLGDGGGLVSGDKVKIGQFPANTGIGWVLLQNAWGWGSVSTNKLHFYSEPSFNPEPSASWQQHSVALYDAGRNLVLIGFEDLYREGGSGDNDFNDLVFYATSNPVTAINNVNMPQAASSVTDTDGDGIGDLNDEYPNDVNRAFNNYTPTANGYGTLAFEDLWPSKGDYDFNDLVIDYRINEVTDANNDVVELKAKFVLKAIGGGFHNGFGFELPIAPSQVASVTGSDLSNGYITTNANGTEAAQTNAVILVFDDAYSRMQPSGGAFVNTSAAGNYVTPDTIEIGVVFTSPIAKTTLGFGPYNPFMVVNMQRGYEIHLPGYMPTDLVNTNLFGQEDDDTDIANNKLYKSDGNLPWAIDLPQSFDYPAENMSIEAAYLKFSQWAQSGGFSHMDWYSNNNSAFRDVTKIYNK